jgi:hypothetical protein
MTGGILESLARLGAAEVTLLPAALAPCRPDGYTEKCYLRSDTVLVGTCLAAHVETLTARIDNSSLVLLGTMAKECVTECLLASGQESYIGRLCCIKYPCYWEREDCLAEAHEALAARMSDFMTLGQLRAVVKTAGRTPNRNSMPRSQEAITATRQMGQQHVEDCRRRRAEQEIGADVDGIRRRVSEGKRLVQICHEMCVPSRTVFITLGNTKNKEAQADLVASLHSVNDEETDRASQVDVDYMRAARAMGFSAHLLCILHPTPVSWKDVSRALKLEGNVARERDAPRIRAYNDPSWLTSDEVRALVAGSRSVERVARVLLPPKSAHLSEWVDFVEEIEGRAKEADANPRACQTYMPPAARKRRREEQAATAEAATTVSV